VRYTSRPSYPLWFDHSNNIHFKVPCYLNFSILLLLRLSFAQIFRHHFETQPVFVDPLGRGTKFYIHNVVTVGKDHLNWFSVICICMGWRTHK
jgi:hypothetical protein